MTNFYESDGSEGEKFRETLLKFWQKRTIYHHRGSQILANPAKAMVDMISCVFQDLGIDRRLGDPELDFALGRWW